MINKIIKSKYSIFFGLCLIAFLAAFSSPFNPFNFREMYIDSSVYITVTHGITQGQLPYRDLADNKGPLLYLISVPGYFLGKFTGVWITELILLFISVLFAYKTAFFFGSKLNAFLGSFFCFIVLLAFFNIFIGTEEYSLPFFMFSFYIFTKYYFSEKNEIYFYELIILGISFSCSVIMRLNLFPIWAGFCSVIFIEYLIKRQYLQLLKFISGFLSGIIIVFVPLYLYLKLNGIFNDFLIQVIFAGTSRGFSDFNLRGFVQTFYFVINTTYTFIPLFWGIYWIIAKFRQEKFLYYIAYTFSFVLLVIFLSISPYGSRCNLVFIPFFIPVITNLVNIIYSSFSEKKLKRTLIIFLLFFIFTNEGVGKYFWNLAKLFDLNSADHLYNTGKIIDENTKDDDKIISLGINGYIYPFTKRRPASRFFYQGAGLNQIPGAREEFISDILTNKPEFIILYTGRPEDNIQYIEEWHKEILVMKEIEYHLFSSVTGFDLYKRNF